MRYRHPSFLSLILGLLIIAAASGAGAPAFGANCGGATACSCGDTVTESRTLVCGVDPVTTTICLGDGLIVARLDPDLDPPVDLNLGFCIITGNGANVGILIADDEVTVRSGKVTRFGAGIATAMAPTTGSTLAGLQVYSNGVGIDVTADDSTIRNNVSRENGNDGFSIDGTGTTIKQNRSERNG